MPKYSLKYIVKFFYTIAPSSHRRRFWWLCLLNTFMGFFEIGVAGEISLLGVAMSSPESLTHLPLLSDFAAQVPFSKNVPDTLRMLTIIMMCIFLATAAKNCLLAYITWQQNYFSQGIAWSIGQKLFQRFFCAPYLWHTHQNSAELLTILNWKAYIATFSVAILTLVTQAIIPFFFLVVPL